MSRLLRSFAPLLALLLLPSVLLWPVVFQGQAFLPADLLRDIAPWRTSNPSHLIPWNPLMWDGMAEFYPWRAFYAATLNTGYLPLWNPHQFCGTPFTANSQSAIFYPLNLVFCLMPVWRAFGVSVLLHLVLTGSFAYLYLRRGMRIGRSASLLGAVSWQMCHWQVAWLALPTFLCVSAWLPLALFLVDRAGERPSPFRALPLGICLGLMLLAGHLQIAVYCFGLILAYALFRIAPRLKSDWRRLLPCAGVALAMTFGLAAPQLLPAVELARVSHRAGGIATWEAYQSYVRLAVPLVHLMTLFAPSFFGSPTRGTYWGIGLNGGPGAYMEYACYGGILTLLLAIFAIVSTWRPSATTRFWTFTAAAALLLALGTPLNMLLFFGIPGFAQTGSPGRILVVWSFCLPVLAAIGLDSLLRQFAPRALGQSLLTFVFLAALTLGLTALWIVRNAPAGILAANLRSEGGDLWRLPVGIILAVAAALWLHQRNSLPTPAFGGALAALVALDLLASGYGFNRTTVPQNVYPVTPLIAFLQAHAEEGRIMPINRRWSLYDPPPAILPPNAAMVYGLYDTQGYDSLLTGQYFQFAGAMDGGSPAPQENGNMVFTYGVGSPQARAASARFIVTREPLTFPDLTLRFSDNGAYVYEDARALPLIRTEKLAEKFFVEAGPPTRMEAEGGGDQDFARIIVADQWYPGWTAKFDGESAEVIPGPYIFRTVLLTPRMRQESGLKTFLEMRYEPMSIRLGLYLFCLTLGGAAALGAAALTDRLRHRRGC